MSSTTFGDLFNEAETGVSAASVPTGTYDVTVIEARGRAQSSVVFLTLSIDSGPTAGKTSEVNLYFPGTGDKGGARFHFVKKFRGFAAYPDVKAAFEAADGAPTPDDAFDLIAGALEGKRVQADIVLREEGEYKGTNELRATSPLEGPVQPAQQPVQPVQQPTPQPQAPQQPAGQPVQPAQPAQTDSAPPF